MAATARQSAVTGEMTPEEQAQLDQMRADDNAPQDDAPQDQGGDQGQQAAGDGAADAGDGEPSTQQPQPRQHPAIVEERERRREAERRANEAEQARRVLEERTNLLLQRIGQQSASQGQQQPQGPTLPDLQTDPLGHILARMDQDRSIMTQVVQALATQNQRSQMTDQATALRQRTNALENEFAARTPDYQQAASHLLAARHRELEAAGWTDPAERHALLSREAEGLAARALQLGKNPGEMVYEIAKARGYAPALADTTQAQAASTPTGEQQVRTIERGQQQSRSVGQLRGSAPTPLTAQRLIEMSEAEFSKVMETPEGRALLGV